MTTEHCIFFQLAKAYQSGTRFWKDKLAPFGVTAVQGLVMAFLEEKDHISSVALGQRVQLDSATLTGVLDRLEGLGYIERQKNPRDRRAILIQLTGEGRKHASRIARALGEGSREFLSRLDSREEDMLRALLIKIREG